MNKPLIGVLPLVDKDKESYWMLPGYMTGVEQAGGLPVMLPLTADDKDLAQLARAFDGFLYTGGQDVSPSLYNEPERPECGETSLERDQMELSLLRRVLDLDKPLLGICRGIQFLNAALGGTLYQDLPSEKPSELEHHQTPPYDVPVHAVTIEPDTPLALLLGKDSLMVNSYHHQAVKELARPLQAMGHASDGLVEAVWMAGARFVWALQWHPEFSWRTDADSRRIFQAFVDACRR